MASKDYIRKAWFDPKKRQDMKDAALMAAKHGRR